MKFPLHPIAAISAPRPPSSAGRWKGGAIGLFLSSALLFGLPAARAHDLRADASPDNDWIEGLVNGESAPCCGSNDCYPLASGALHISPANGFSVAIGGRWLPVPEHSLVRDSSPDGRPWVCPKSKPVAGGYMYRIEGIRCLLLPMLM